LPPDRVEPADAREADVQSFRAQQFALELQAAVPAESAAGSDDAMAGGRAIAAAAHDVADGSGRPRAAREGSDIAVGCDAPWRNPPDGGEHAPLELGHREVPTEVKGKR
jgi:hypothetical protein